MLGFEIHEGIELCECDRTFKVGVNSIYFEVVFAKN